MVKIVDMEITYWLIITNNNITMEKHLKGLAKKLGFDLKFDKGIYALSKDGVDAFITTDFKDVKEYLSNFGRIDSTEILDVFSFQEDDKIGLNGASFGLEVKINTLSYKNLYSFGGSENILRLICFKKKTIAGNYLYEFKVYGSQEDAVSRQALVSSMLLDIGSLM